MLHTVVSFQLLGAKGLALTFVFMVSFSTEDTIKISVGLVFKSQMALSLASPNGLFTFLLDLISVQI